jgi:uracil-DNA glycosylase
VSENQNTKIDELHRKMRNCRLCLVANYDVTPPAVVAGDPGARIMTIGQAPGITEVEAGRPFNAGSGKRLFDWLEEAGIEETWFRDTQYMTAVTKCYPGRAKSGSGDRVPTRQEQTFCRPFLDKEIQLINPELIIPIGRLAISLFFSKKLRLTEIIGLEKNVDGVWIAPLPHSSGASRWHQTTENRLLIQKAIKIIGKHVERIFPKGI